MHNLWFYLNTQLRFQYVHSLVVDQHTVYYKASFKNLATNKWTMETRRHYKTYLRKISFNLTLSSSREAELYWLTTSILMAARPFSQSPTTVELIAI